MGMNMRLDNELVWLRRRLADPKASTAEKDRCRKRERDILRAYKPNDPNA